MSTDPRTTDGAADVRPTPARRRRVLSLGALTLVTVATGSVFVVSAGGADEEESSASQATATAEIERKDLVERDEVDGTLGYADTRTVVNRLSGTVTWAASEGTRVKRNHRLFEVDGQAVYLLNGSYPAYRDLGPGDEGEDVEQLERNLRRLGLDEDEEMDVDGDWDDGTTAAVRRWQRRKGMDDDGTVEHGRIVFAPGTRRVGQHLIEVGSPSSGGGQASGDSASAGQPASTAASGAGTGVASDLMTTTSTRRIVTVDLETGKSRLAERGAEVSVELPDGEDVEGEIVEVGTVAEREQNSDGTEGDATIELTIELRGKKGKAIDQAPVDVSLEQQRAEDVLTIPVTALLSRSGGGFAVEVVEGATRRVVPVETGLSTDGDVEIEGEGLDAGVQVTDARV